ncbi:unnamed protein product [Cyprideis torosa]|uniref:Uncharacterized protein n=1 Tax=Cyprideis torosa TaxID=163714 RepID=A0A7R8W6B4_9CRUS|nr:unnamed protein product [Cyprideis torosa]CAG0881177.1 unnamed protein product [Cyprideis torosa]
MINEDDDDEVYPVCAPQLFPIWFQGFLAVFAFVLLGSLLSLLSGFASYMLYSCYTELETIQQEWGVQPSVMQRGTAPSPAKGKAVTVPTGHPPQAVRKVQQQQQQQVEPPPPQKKQPSRRKRPRIGNRKMGSSKKDKRTRRNAANSIMQSSISNGLQGSLHSIKLENPPPYGYSYTPPGPDASLMSYSPLSVAAPRSSSHSPQPMGNPSPVGAQSPSAPRVNGACGPQGRSRRVSSESDEPCGASSDLQSSDSTGVHSSPLMSTGKLSTPSSVILPSVRNPSSGDDSEHHRVVVSPINTRDVLPSSLSLIAPLSHHSGTGPTSTISYYPAPTTVVSTSGGSGLNGGASPPKYCQENGHDFTDFVTLVCQEGQNPTIQVSQAIVAVSGTTSSARQKLPPHYTMLPPPPPAPMARPVAIIRSTGVPDELHISAETAVARHTTNGSLGGESIMEETEKGQLTDPPIQGFCPNSLSPLASHVSDEANSSPVRSPSPHSPGDYTYTLTSRNELEMLCVEDGDCAILRDIFAARFRVDPIFRRSFATWVEEERSEESESFPAGSIVVTAFFLALFISLTICSILCSTGHCQRWFCLALDRVLIELHPQWVRKEEDLVREEGQRLSELYPSSGIHERYKHKKGKLFKKKGPSRAIPEISQVTMQSETTTLSQGQSVQVTQGQQSKNEEAASDAENLPPPPSTYTVSFADAGTSAGGVISAGPLSPSSHLNLFSNSGSSPNPGSSPVRSSTPPRSLPRWNNTTFMSLDENMDYQMMSTLLPDGTAGHHLMDDDRYFGHPSNPPDPVPVVCSDQTSPGSATPLSPCRSSS